MTATRHSLHTPPALALWRIGRDACASVARLLRQGVDAWQRQRQALALRRALQELGAMSDHQLRDLGIDRSELLSLALHPDDPTRARHGRHC